MLKIRIIKSEIALLVVLGMMATVMISIPKDIRAEGESDIIIEGDQYVSGIGTIFKIVNNTCAICCYCSNDILSHEFYNNR